MKFARAQYLVETLLESYEYFFPEYKELLDAAGSPEESLAARMVKVLTPSDEERERIRKFPMERLGFISRTFSDESLQSRQRAQTIGSPSTKKSDHGPLGSSAPGPLQQGNVVQGRKKSLGAAKVKKDPSPRSSPSSGEDKKKKKLLVDEESKEKKKKKATDAEDAKDKKKKKERNAQKVRKAPSDVDVMKKKYVPSPLLPSPLLTSPNPIGNVHCLLHLPREEVSVFFPLPHTTYFST